ncbi:MAG: hypothetical protein SOW25_07065 [Helicobacter sp.]|nr:hypothetical protein [Helicobacter sp.]
MTESDWEAIYKLDFINFTDCYKTCDSYCCKNFLGKHFKILDKEAVILPLLESEFNFYQKKGGISGIKDIKKEVFKLKNQKEFSLYFLTCTCKGLCTPHNLRPLICRIYPYFPCVSTRGEIIGFKAASFMDLFFKDNSFHPCTLVREHSIELQNSLRESLKPLMRYPLLIFSFKALEILAKFLELKMQDEANIFSESFFKKLEWNLISRKAWSVEACKNEISTSYDEIAKIYGDFL